MRVPCWKWRWYVPPRPRVFHCPTERRWLPVPRLRPAFYRADNFIRHPAAVKTTRLRSHAFIVDSTFNQRRIERKRAAYRDKLRHRFFIALPNRAPRIDTSERPIAGQPLRFARRVARHANESRQVDISGRKVKRRWARRLQNSESRDSARNQYATRPHLYTPAVWHDARRARIVPVPDRLLPFYGCNGKIRPLLAAILPKGLDLH